MTDDPDAPARRDETAVRERVWDSLVAAGVAGFPGAHGRIPDFPGAGRAAERRAGLDAWRSATT